MDASFFLFKVTVSAVIAVMLIYVILRWRLERRFKEWQSLERQSIETEKACIRKSAINQSRAVLGGKFVEQLAPYLPDFKYDPTEARFIGTPFDLIIFPGLASGEPQEIIIMEIKTGKNCQLTSSERKIKELIEDGMVRWELFQPRLEKVNGEED
jgi:predicted Holliday junction resolvase-like endonuclease